MVNILNATDGSTLEINGWLIWYSCGNQPSWKPQVYAKNSAKTYDGTDTPKTETTVHSVSQMLLCLSAATMPSSRPTTAPSSTDCPPMRSDVGSRVCRSCAMGVFLLIL